ncbi:MAG: hypothetical protein AMXMBFR78_03760 [Rubrivivax sp.]|jgi:hypothetical protein
MTLIQSLFRRLSSKPAAAPTSPVPLQPEQLKAVSGGSPFHRW